MTTTSSHTNSDKKKQDKTNRQQRRNSAPIRRSAAELIASPPRGYTCTVHELENKESTARKRVRLLVLESENGWKFVPFMSVRVEKNARTAGADIAVLDDFDIIPSNIIESGIEVNLLSDDALLNLAALAAEYRERQKAVVPIHKRPFVQRPFEHKLAGIHIEENDMAKKKKQETAKSHAQPKPEPKRPVVRGEAWWFAAAC